jgi:23S rRNA A1618 N6-methylase RlmF
LRNKKDAFIDSTHTIAIDSSTHSKTTRERNSFFKTALPACRARLSQWHNGTDRKERATTNYQSTGTSMDVDEDSSSSRKRRHPDSSTSTPKNSLELLKLVESPNFEELCRRYPEFEAAFRQVQQKQHEAKSKAFFSSCVTPEFSIALSRGLLHSYFDLRLPHLPSHHLCPPVPNRLFYIHWIQSHLLPLAKQSIDNGSQSGDVGLSNWGMDLGVGASCIYPLLAAKVFHCNMVGSEIDVNSLAVAQANVQANKLDNLIKLIAVSPSHSQEPSSPPGGPLQRALEASQQPLRVLPSRLDFVMSNPPFYDTNSIEHLEPRAGDGRERTPMTDSEGIYPDGEVGFCMDMIADSLQARRSSLWYSCMLGKKTCLTKLHKLLVHMLGPAHVETTEYGPGHWTRWFLAWTLERQLGCAPLARIQHAKDSFQVTLVGEPGQLPVAQVAQRIEEFCGSSPGGWHLTATTLWSGGLAKVKITESTPLVVSSFVDESEPNVSLPPALIEALKGQDNNQFLPLEGHFVIYVTVQPTNNANAVSANLACYRHSARGLKAIEKIRDGMEAEVCRTNRKWRRILQRQEQEQNQQQTKLAKPF